MTYLSKITFLVVIVLVTGEAGKGHCRNKDWFICVVLITNNTEETRYMLSRDFCCVLLERYQTVVEEGFRS